MRFSLSSGRALGYRTSGAGRPVVLLHPVGLNSGFWDDVIVALSACRTIAIDLSGHGDSDVPAGKQTLRELALDVIELIQAVGQPPVTVVGCSLGGMVAQAIGIERPDLVAGLILANTSHDRNAASRAALGKRADAALVGMPAVIGETIDRWFNEAYVQAHPQRVERLRLVLEAADPVVHARTWLAIAGLDHGHRLSRIEAPALIVTGSDDRSVPRAAALAMAEDLPNARHVEFERAGHLTPYEQPAAFADLLENFLSGLPDASIEVEG